MLGCIYFVMMMLGAMTVRVPPEGWKPAGWTPPRALGAVDDHERERHGRRTRSSTPQFWLLWIVLFCNVTAGIGILEQASPMIQDHFPSGHARRPPPASSACSRSAT